MEFLDARRLTGPNLVWEYPGAILDIALAENDDIDVIVTEWRQHVRRMLDAVGWDHEKTATYRVSGGISFAITAPDDCLYAAAELIEWAWHAAEADFSGTEAETFDAASIRLHGLIEEESNAGLIAMADAAATHAVAFLSDDDFVSAGLGRGSVTWPVDGIPPPDTVDWSAIHDIPVGIVTGTNGKTTSVRLAAAIVRAAGLNVGLSSTDWIGVNATVIDRGDYSGPGGARAILREREVDVAILETARGGLLRRGLGVREADAALITNIAEDHLGDFGSQSLTELLNVKWVVTGVVAAGRPVVLNADDPLLVERARDTGLTIAWFSLDADNPLLRNHTAAGGKAVTVRDGNMTRYDGTRWRELCPVVDVPVTLNGIARHNIANALGAVGLASALGIDDTAIAAGLCSMSADDNPGRCNLFSTDGFDVLLDFAHNPQGMAALFDIASRHPAKRRLLSFAQAGDRTDAQIRELARSAWAIGLDHVIVSELADYRRGREPGEVFELLRDELLASGASAAQISYNELETESLDEAMEWAQPGDLIIMLALASAPEILKILKSY